MIAFTGLFLEFAVVVEIVYESDKLSCQSRYACVGRYSAKCCRQASKPLSAPGRVDRRSTLAATMMDLNEVSQRDDSHERPSRMREMMAVEARDWVCVSTWKTYQPK